MKLSDFQKPAAAFRVDPKVLDRNAAVAGNSVDVEATKIGIPKGGTLGGADDPFAVMERAVKRSIAMDAERSKRQRMHAALDRMLDAAEENPDPTEYARPRYNSEKPADESSSEEEEEESSSQEPEESDDERKQMHRMLDALMDGTFTLPKKPAKVVAADRTYAKDCAPGKPCCMDCGNLDGVVAVNRAHRQRVV